MRVGDSTIQITTAFQYENADYVILWCENPGGNFPCDIDLWVKLHSSSASCVSYDYFGMMAGTNLPRSLAGIEGEDEEPGSDSGGKDSKPDYSFENLNSCALFKCKTLGYKKTSFSAALRCKKGTLAKAFFEAKNIAEPNHEIYGHHYPVVRIGDLIWMAENFCSPKGGVFYEGNQSNFAKGRYYTKEEAEALAPEGWRLPATEEMEALIEHGDYHGILSKETWNLGELTEQDREKIDSTGFGLKKLGYQRSDTGDWYEDMACLWTQTSKFVFCNIFDKYYDDGHDNIFKIKRCPVRYVKELECNPIERVPRLEGETFSCECYLEIPYGTEHTHEGIAYKDKIPADGNGHWSYTYPIANLLQNVPGMPSGHMLNQAIMFRDENDCFHCVEPVWPKKEAGKPDDYGSLKQRLDDAVNRVIWQGSIPPAKMKFYQWFRGVATKGKDGIGTNQDARDPGNWTGGMPLLTMDPMATYYKQISGFDFFKIDPFANFSLDTFKDLITPFARNSCPDCIAVMDKIDSSSNIWNDFQMILKGYSWIFYDGIDYKIPEEAADIHNTSDTNAKGDIIRPYSGINSFLWFKGKCRFDRPLTWAAQLSGMIAILDGDIEAVPDFLTRPRMEVETEYWVAYTKVFLIKHANNYAAGFLITNEDGYNARLWRLPYVSDESQAAADQNLLQSWLNEVLSQYAYSLYEIIGISLSDIGQNAGLTLNDAFGSLDCSVSMEQGGNYDLVNLILNQSQRQDFVIQRASDSIFGGGTLHGLMMLPDNSMLMEFVGGTKLKCPRLTVEGIVPNDCMKVDIPDTDLILASQNVVGSGLGESSRDWNGLISLKAKSVRFMTNQHSGYRLLSPSVWEEGLPQSGKLEFKADADVRKGTAWIDSSLSAKAEGCQISLNDDDETGEQRYTFFSTLILDNARVKGTKFNQPFVGRLEVRGDCSIECDLRTMHWVDAIIIHDKARLRVEMRCDDATPSSNDGGFSIQMLGDCELAWDVPWPCFVNAGFDGKSLDCPAVLRDVRKTMRIQNIVNDSEWKNAVIYNALAFVVGSDYATSPLLNSLAFYDERYQDPGDNDFLGFGNSVPNVFWHFRALPKIPGAWRTDEEDSSIAVFQLDADSAWGIDRYYALTAEAGWLGEHSSIDLENREIRIKLPDDKSYLGRCAVACREDNHTIEETPFPLWKSLEAGLARQWNTKNFKDSRRCELTLFHENGLWIGDRTIDRPVFELWFSPDWPSIGLVRAEMEIDDSRDSGSDISDVKNWNGINMFTSLRLRMNFSRWPQDIPSGRIEVRFKLSGQDVVASKDIRAITEISDSCLARFHSHEPAGKQLLGEPGSVMLDVTNVNPWSEAVLGEVMEIANQLEFMDGKPARGIAEFVPFEVSGKNGETAWYGEKYPIKNEKNQVVGVRRKLRVIGAGSVKVRIRQKGKVYACEDKGWLCDESLRANLGKKLDILRWLPAHLKKSEFTEFLKNFEDSLNNCFADSETNSPIGLLEKIARLSDLRNPDRMEPRFFQNYADLFGIELTAAVSVLSPIPEDERPAYVRNVLKAWSQFQREKTTLTAFQTLLSMFGAFSQIKYMHSGRYHPRDKDDWSLHPSDGKRITQHFVVHVRADSEDMMVFSPSFKQLVNDIKPVTNVFDGWMGYMRIPLEETGEAWLSMGASMKALNVIEDSEICEDSGEWSSVIIEARNCVTGELITAGAIAVGSFEKQLNSQGRVYFTLPSGCSYEAEAVGNEHYEGKSFGFHASGELHQEQICLEPYFTVSVIARNCIEPFQLLEGTVFIGSESKELSGGTAVFRLIRGEYEAFANSEGFGGNSINFAISDADAVIELCLIPTVIEIAMTVTVKNQDGDALAGASVIFNGHHFMTDASGQAFMTVNPGTYEASASKEHYETASAACEVAISPASQYLDMVLEAIPPPTIYENLPGFFNTGNITLTDNTKLENLFCNGSVSGNVPTITNIMMVCGNVSMGGGTYLGAQVLFVTGNATVSGSVNVGDSDCAGLCYIGGTFGSGGSNVEIDGNALMHGVSGDFNLSVAANLTIDGALSRNLNAYNFHVDGSLAFDENGSLSLSGAGGAAERFSVKGNCLLPPSISLNQNAVVYLGQTPESVIYPNSKQGSPALASNGTMNGYKRFSWSSGNGYQLDVLTMGEYVNSPRSRDSVADEWGFGPSDSKIALYKALMDGGHIPDPVTLDNVSSWRAQARAIQGRLSDNFSQWTSDFNAWHQGTANKWLDWLVVEFEAPLNYNGTPEPLNGNFIFVVNGKNRFRCPPVTASSSVFVYFLDGAGDIEKANASEHYNYVIFSGSSITQMMNWGSCEFKGSVFVAYPYNLGTLQNGINIKVNRNLLEKLTDDGIIIPNQLFDGLFL